MGSPRADQWGSGVCGGGAPSFPGTLEMSKTSRFSSSRLSACSSAAPPVLVLLDSPSAISQRFGQFLSDVSLFVVPDPSTGGSPPPFQDRIAVVANPGELVHAGKKLRKYSQKG